MWARLGRGWSMARTSFAVLRRCPDLMILSGLSGGLSVLGMGVLFLTGAMWVWLGADSVALFLAGCLFTFPPILFALVVTIEFCTVALIHCALRALQGETPALREGLSAASSRLPQILGWALLLSTLGLAVRFVEAVLQKLGFIGEIFGHTLDLGWSATTYFVAPVLAAEGLGPIAAMNRSSVILREKWGESVAGEARFGVLGTLFMIPALVLFIPGLKIVTEHGAAAMAGLGPLLMAVGLVYGSVVAIVLQTLNTVFRAGVYLYATTGSVPSAFDADLVIGTFRRKN